MAMLGIKVPEEIGQKISKLSVPGERLETDEYHITMFYFEQELKLPEILKIIQLVYGTLKNTPSFGLRSRLISSFPEGPDGVPVLLKIDSEPLMELRKSLGKKFDKNDIKYSKVHPEFKPHVTLSYSKKEFEDKKLSEPIKWKASELYLWAGENMDSGIIVTLPLGMKKRSQFDFLHIYAELLENMTMKIG